MIKLYDLKLTLTSQLAVGKTYYKDKTIGFPVKRLLPIKVLTHSGGIVTATLGTDGLVQTLTEDEAMAYINHQGGFDDTP